MTNIRLPVRAGTFYEESPSSCRRHAEKLLAAAQPPADLPGRLFGGIVPHAGWMYSGALAAETFKALATHGTLETVVILGADHCGTVGRGEVYDSGAWRTPLGEIAIDEELASALLEDQDLLRANPKAHAGEHSIEVQLPLLQVLAPRAKIVPIGMPPSELAVDIGRRVGQTMKDRFPHALVVASTDLTHHAGHFPAPGGRGEKGVRWTEENDRRMISLVESMSAEKIVPEYESRSNACGAGAVAGAVAAAREIGATRGLLLEYTNSYRIIHKLYPYEMDDTTVGYASMVFV